MDDYKISLGAILDANAKGDLQKSIDAIKDLNVKISKAELSQSAIADIKRQFEKNGIDLKVVFGNTSQIVNQAKQTGQQIGQIISDSANKAINSVSSPSISRYFKVDSSTSNQFRSEMEKMVSVWTNAKGKLTDLKIDTRTTYDKDEEKNIERLHQALVTYKNELNEVIKKTIAWRQIGTTTDAKGNETPLRGFVEVASQYSKSIDEVNSKTSKFVTQQKTTITNLQNQIEQINRAANDTNATRPIGQENLTKLKDKYVEINAAIKGMYNLSGEAFTDQQNRVKTLIANFKSLVSEYRNADNVSSNLKGTNLESGKTIAGQNFEKLKQDAKEYSTQMGQTFIELEGAFDKISDSASLNSFTDKMREARAELARLKSEAMANSRAEKIGINVSDFQSKINDLKRISPEISDFKTQINGAEVSIESLAFELDNVKTQGDISVLNAKWRAFTDAAKAAGIAIKETATSSTSLQEKVNNIQFKMDNGHGVSEYQNRIIALEQELQKYGVSADRAGQETAELRNIFNSMQGLSGEELIAAADRLEREFKAVKVSIDEAKLSYDKFNQPVSSEKVTSLINRINTFLTKNTRITKNARTELEGFVNELNRVGATGIRFNQINQKLKETENSMRGLHRLGAGLKDQLSQAATSFAQWMSVSQLIMFGISKTKEAITEFKELDTILTEISKTSDLTTQQLKELGETSFDSASKYGKKASDYLTGVQEMSRSGFYGKQGEGMAEQSLLAQAAGDIDADTANKYVLATNAAYKFRGEAEKINEVIDGQNMVTNRNSVALSDMATAMSEVGTVASEYRVPVEDLTAMIGTIEAVTKSGGSEGGNAIKAILINLQNVTSSKIVDTLNSANASMTEMVNGAEKLRNPIDILRDLSKTFNELDEDDPLRAEILTNIGQKYHATKLSALLSNMDMYDKMLKDYSEGEGSAFAEAEKSANNLEGSLNKLSNQWAEFINQIVTADGLKTGVNMITGLLNVITNISSALGSLGIIGVGAGLFAGIQNIGRDKMYSLMF